MASDRYIKIVKLNTIAMTDLDLYALAVWC